MPIITLEQEGWKRVCPKSELFINDIKRVLSTAGYNTVESAEYLLCEPLISKLSPIKKLIYISNYLDKNNYSKWRSIIYSQSYLSNNPYVKHHKAYIADPENVKKRFLEKRGIESFKALRSLVSITHPSEIIDILWKYAVPSFFEKYPNGKIYFVRCDDMLATMNSGARVLSDADIFGVDLFKKSKNIKKEIPRSMRRVHQVGLDVFIETTLESILWGFFPFLYGFMASRIGGYIIFLLDKPLKTEPKKSTYDYFREGGIFNGIEGKRSIEQLLNLVRKREIDYKVAYKRYSHELKFSVNEISKIIVWAIQQLNDFYIKILDFCNFCNKKDFIDFTLHRKIFLTLERIFIEINNIILSTDSYTRKVLYFDLHDKISNLMVTSSLNREEVFRRLLRPSHFKRKISKILKNLPQSFDSYIINYGNEIYNALISSSVKYIWDKTRKTKKGIQLREVNLGNKNEWIGRKYKDSRTKIQEEEYTINLIHQFRNTLHGYILRNYKFEKYLAIHEGIISDYLPDLSLLWLFIILNDVNKVLNSDIVKA